MHRCPIQGRAAGHTEIPLLIIVAGNDVRCRCSGFGADLPIVEIGGYAEGAAGAFFAVGAMSNALNAWLAVDRDR